MKLVFYIYIAIIFVVVVVFVIIYSKLQIFVLIRILFNIL